MKILKLFFIVNLLFIEIGFAQTYYVWTGNGSTNSFLDGNNWDAGSTPEFNDDVIIVFSTGEVFTVTDVPSGFTIGGLEIFQNSDNNSPTRVNFVPQSTLSIDTIYNIVVDAGCLMGFNDDLFEIYTEFAEINGDVEFNNAAHRLQSVSNDGDIKIHFNNGSKFFAGDFLTGHPFGDSHPNSVVFYDGSVYQHHGGDSPFGPESAGSGPIVDFAPESDFEIYNNNLVQFSGRKYGNIIVKTSAGVQNTAVTNMNTVIFQFTDLVVETGFFDFYGTDTDAILITGDTISSEGGEIYLQGGDGGISFNNYGNQTRIIGSNNIIFKIFSASGMDLAFVSPDTELILENNIQLEAENPNVNFWVYGNIDCKNSIISFPENNASVVISSQSVFKTENQTGVIGSVPNIFILNGATLIFNGLTDQVTGIPDVPGFLYLDELVMNNSASLLLDNDLETKLLTLNAGNFMINQQTLRISGNITYSDGVLSGNPDFSRLEFVEVDGTSNNITLKTPLSISDLSLSITGEIALIDGEELFVQDSLELFSGKLDIQNSNLQLGENIVVNTLNGNQSYIIAENNGFVKKIFTSDADNVVRIPVGSSNFYSEIQIIPDFNSEFAFNVFEYVYSEGWSGNQYNENMLNLTWNIESPASDIPADIQFFWVQGSSVEMPGFDHSNAYISNFDEALSYWDNEPTSSIFITGTPTSLTGISRKMYSFGLFSITSSLINNNPNANAQEFTVLEGSPNGTVVGKMAAVDPDPEQVLNYYIQENHTNPDAFDFLSDGTITVKNQEFLVHALNPLFIYNVDVCDDGIPSLCSSFELSIKLEPKTHDIQISNFLSPNNDSYNDTWKIRGADFMQTDVFVYTATGQLVFEAGNYSNNWDGTVNGKLLPDGVYYYIVRTERIEYRGSLTLIR